MGIRCSCLSASQPKVTTEGENQPTIEELEKRQTRDLRLQALAAAAASSADTTSFAQRSEPADPGTAACLCCRSGRFWPCSRASSNASSEGGIAMPSASTAVTTIAKSLTPIHDAADALRVSAITDEKSITVAPARANPARWARPLLARSSSAPAELEPHRAGASGATEVTGRDWSPDEGPGLCAPRVLTLQLDREMDVLRIQYGRDPTGGEYLAARNRVYLALNHRIPLELCELVVHYASPNFSERLTQLYHGISELGLRFGSTGYTIDRQRLAARFPDPTAMTLDSSTATSACTNAATVESSHASADGLGQVGERAKSRVMTRFTFTFAKRLVGIKDDGASTNSDATACTKNAPPAPASAATVAATQNVPSSALWHPAVTAAAETSAALSSTSTSTAAASAATVAAMRVGDASGASVTTDVPPSSVGAVGGEAAISTLSPTYRIYLAYLTPRRYRDDVGQSSVLLPGLIQDDTAMSACSVDRLQESRPETYLELNADKFEEAYRNFYRYQWQHGRQQRTMGICFYAALMLGAKASVALCHSRPHRQQLIEFSPE
jgi:hypothetical protein